MARIRSLRVVDVFLPTFFLLFVNCAFAEEKPTPEQMIRSSQDIVADLESHLQMPEHIEVCIVSVEERMVSMQRIRKASGNTDLFMISFDRAFLSSLNQNELTAAIAHELGHVWISSHHPYLQTESLANEIAMRVVSRDSLKALYSKLWLHLGTTGDLEELLGSEKAQPPTSVPVITSAARRD